MLFQRRTIRICTFLLFAGVPRAIQGQETVQLPTADGLTLYADYHVGPSDGSSGTLLLFHQAGANGRAEYAAVLPRLLAAGFSALVVDLRSGGDRFGGENRTVAGLGGVEYGYCEAYPDLEAALRWAGETGSRRVFAWGSSYSAALVIRLAAEHGAELTGVLAFSPASGEPMAECDPAAFIDRVSVPLLALRPSNEMEIPAVALQLDRFRSAGAVTHVARPGSHGSSMLDGSRVDGDVEPTWTSVLSFLRDPGAPSR